MTGRGFQGAGPLVGAGRSPAITGASPLDPTEGMIPSETRDLREAGFTLVEMLVTLVIVGLAVAVASHSAGSGAGRRADRLAAALGAEIGLLRAQALRTGETARLVLDPETGRFLSSRPGAAPIATAPLAVLVEAGTPGEIRLLADGSSSGGRILLGSPGAGVVLSVGALTARVHREAAR